MVVVEKGDREMLEKEVERHLRDGVRSMGGWCLKLVCPGFTGMPDRLVLIPGGAVCFAELKRPGQKERQRQAFVQSRLRKMGFIVFSGVDGWARVDDVLMWCAGRMAGVTLEGEGISSGPAGHVLHRGKASRGGDD